MLPSPPIQQANDRTRRRQQQQQRSSPKQQQQQQQMSRHVCKSQGVKMLAGLAAVLLCFVIAAPLDRVECSPPVDYFIYLSQMAHEFAQHNEGARFSADVMRVFPMLGAVNASKPMPRRLDALFEQVARAVMNGSRHSHDNDKVDVEMARLAWHMMEKQALMYISDRMSSLRPLVAALIARSNVSDACHTAIDIWMDKLSELDYWAVSMWNAWGSMPVSGLFEGSFTDLGSYRGCLEARAGDEAIGEPRYCVLSFQPLVPTRPRFHTIFHRTLETDSNGTIYGGDFERLDTERPLRRRSKVSSGEFASYYVRKAYKPVMVTSHVRNMSHASHLAERTNTNASAHTPLLDDEPDIQSGAMSELIKAAHFFYYIKLRLGSCWPSACTTQDVERIARNAGQAAVLQSTPVHCVTQSEHTRLTINTHQWVAIVVLGSFAAIVGLMSALDMLIELLRVLRLHEAASWLSDMLEDHIAVWSLSRNMSKLFVEWIRERKQRPKATTTTTTTTTECSIMQHTTGDASPEKPEKLAAKQHHDTNHMDDNRLKCLYGLRVLSMVWVIFGHTLLWLDYTMFTHALKPVFSNISSKFVLPVMIPNFSVDVFFLISGLLHTYIPFSLKVKYNPLVFTAARYVRLTPQLLIVILFFFLLPLFDDGPMYHMRVDEQATRCMKNWWVDMLYLQAYVNRAELCVIPSWWLSIDMTLFLIGLGVIGVYATRPKLALWLTGAIAFAMTLYGAYIHYTHKLSIQYLPSIMQSYEVEHEQTQMFFHKPYPHAAAYFAGLALGYVLASKMITRLSTGQLMTGWIVSVACVFTALCVPHYWNIGGTYTQFQSTFYYHLCQILWPISTTWIILACSLGYGGRLNELLSSRLLRPLSRITYMTYLSHNLIVYWFTSSMQHAIEPSNMNIIYLCSTTIVLSLALGALMSMIYEAPLINLQGKLMRRNLGKLRVAQKSVTSTGDAFVYTYAANGMPQEQQAPEHHHRQQQSTSTPDRILLMDRKHSGSIECPQQ